MQLFENYLQKAEKFTQIYSYYMYKYIITIIMFTNIIKDDHPDEDQRMNDLHFLEVKEKLNTMLLQNLVKIVFIYKFVYS